MLNSTKAEKTVIKNAGFKNKKLRLVKIYKEDENKIIDIMTNQLDWTAKTIADPYKSR